MAELLSAQRVQVSYRDREWWTRITRHLLSDARERTAEELRGEIGSYIEWVDRCASSREICEPALLIDFILEFARLAANVGEPGEAGRSVLSAIDGAIDIGGADDPAVASRLWRARASYFRTRTTESDQRRNALRTAIRRAPPGSDEWAGALIDLSEYYVEISRYPSALASVEHIREKRGHVDRSAKYRCGAATAAGVALFTSFQNMKAARSQLAAALRDREFGDDYEWGAWTARALHYLARIDEIEHRYPVALARYLEGLQIQIALPEDTNALGFIHLRIAELLAGRRLFNSAADHVEEARRLLRSGSNQASGLLQTDLAEASLEALRGNPALADQVVRSALARSRDIGFWRGELLALGYLLALQVRKGRLLEAVRIFGKAVRTLQKGELRRNNLLHIARNIPLALNFALYRMVPRKSGRRGEGPIIGCPCDLHAEKGRCTAA